jgi:hypothetical protein
LRQAPRLARDGHEAAFGLRRDVVAGSLARWAQVAEAGDRQVDQLGKSLAHVLGPEAERLHGAGPQVLDDDIALGDQLPGHLATGLALEVQRDGLLAAAVGADHRLAIAADVPGLIARQRLDLDDVGAQFAQDHGRPGPGDVLPQVEHAHALQGRGRLPCLVLF